MISTRESIIGLVCGLSPHLRDIWPLVMLQAYIDESMNDRLPRLLIYGGYISTAEHWLALSDEWTKCLLRGPRLDYFKMSEAMSFQKQFDRARGWTLASRDALVKELYEIIGRHVLGGVWNILVLDAYDEIVKNNPSVPIVFRNRFFYGTFNILHDLYRFSHEIGLHDKMDFIFDDQTRGKKQIKSAWESFKSHAPIPKDRISADPLFRSEIDLPPLQAADFCAWTIRKRAALQAQRKPDKFFWETGERSYKMIGRIVDRTQLLRHIKRAKKP